VGRSFRLALGRRGSGEGANWARDCHLRESMCVRLCLEESAEESAYGALHAGPVVLLTQNDRPRHHRLACASGVARRSPTVRARACEAEDVRGESRRISVNARGNLYSETCSEATVGLRYPYLVTVSHTFCNVLYAKDGSVEALTWIL